MSRKNKEIMPDGRFVEYIHDPLERRIAKKVNGTIEIFRVTS